MSLADKLRSAASKQPEDFAPPKVREAHQLASLEREIAAAAPDNRARSLGSSEAMTKVTDLLKNSVTTAHDDTCAAVERVLADAGKMMDRLSMAVHDHNTRLREDGQRIAHQLEAALQALTNAVIWVEDHTPKLLDPKVDKTAEQVTDSKLLLQPAKPPEEPKNGKKGKAPSPDEPKEG